MVDLLAGQAARVMGRKRRRRGRKRWSRIKRRKEESDGDPSHLHIHVYTRTKMQLLICTRLKCMEAPQKTNLSSHQILSL